MRHIDPGAPDFRLFNKIRRRFITARGPFWSIHCDQNDKLVRWGFPLYGIVDGRSRFFLFLGVVDSNRSPECVVQTYFDIVERLNAVPLRLVSDRGTECSLAQIAQMSLRADHPDPYAGVLSFTQTTSPNDIPIERRWLTLRQDISDYWIEVFRDMESANEFIFGSMCCLYLSRFLCLHLIEADLHEHMLWSNHSTMRGLGGRPWEIFHRYVALVFVICPLHEYLPELFARDQFH